MKQRYFPAYLVLLLLLAGNRLGRADVSGGLDWSAWQRMPVLHDGRIMPLDTLARMQVRKICGEANPRLGMLGSKTNAEVKKKPPTAEQTEKLISEGKPRRYLAAELLYSWIVEPEAWDGRPFLVAADARLRNEILEVPLRGEDGSSLTHVSPRQVRASTKLEAVLDEIQSIRMEAQQKKLKPELTATQIAAKDLAEAFQVFSLLSHDPARDDCRRFVSGDAQNLSGSWRQFRQVLNAPILGSLPGIHPLAGETDAAMGRLLEFFSPGRDSAPAVEDVDAVAGQLRAATARLCGKMREFAEMDLSGAGGLSESEMDDVRGARQTLARWSDTIALAAAKIQWGLFDPEGETVFVLPSLEPTALEADRHRSEIHPWIGLRAVTQGSSRLLQGYPWDAIETARRDWKSARDAYLDRTAADRPARFSAAMRQFAAGLRDIATAVEPARQELPIVERDRGLLAKTAYPAAVLIDAEVFYSGVDPFYWSWVVSLAAAAILAVSFLGLRKPLFWLGIAALVGSVVLLAGGFGLRMYITRWAPVTSMFETVVWVAMCIALLTLWITFLPLLGPTGARAWLLTAIPGTWEGRRRVDATEVALSPAAETGLHWGGLVLRLAAFAAALYLMGFYRLAAELAQGVRGEHLAAGDGAEYTLVSLLPRIDLGSNLPTASSVLVWLASMFVAGVLVWYVPRMLVSAVMAIGLSLSLAVREMDSERTEEVYRWRLVALFGALATSLAAVLADRAPFAKDIQALMPVLRSNFWLGIHVLTITTSYAGAALAWMIGNVALGLYAFGRYRAAGADRSLTTAVQSNAPRRPPAFCGTLATVNYLVLQVTVLLLAAGTILGGLWADVSWGRFWGWDPKEVGALIALLILMIALHGRRSGWPGDLTLAIGAICGFLGVIFAWYVVNFILAAGKHSYGGTEGGQVLWLAILGGCQLLLISLAIIRSVLESGRNA